MTNHKTDVQRSKKTIEERREENKQIPSRNDIVNLSDFNNPTSGRSARSSRSDRKHNSIADES